jgi:hypothetical protein
LSRRPGSPLRPSRDSAAGGGGHARMPATRTARSAGSRRSAGRCRTARTSATSACIAGPRR